MDFFFFNMSVLFSLLTKQIILHTPISEAETSAKRQWVIHFTSNMMVPLLLSQFHSYKSIAIECLGIISLVINLF